MKQELLSSSLHRKEHRYSKKFSNLLNIIIQLVRVRTGIWTSGCPTQQNELFTTVIALDKAVQIREWNPRKL